MHQSVVEMYKRIIKDNERVAAKLESGQMQLYLGPNKDENISAAEAARLRKINSELQELLDRKSE
jgi:hypothetical protein